MKFSFLFIGAFVLVELRHTFIIFKRSIMRELVIILFFASFAPTFAENNLLRTGHVDSIPAIFRKDYELGHILPERVHKVSAICFFAIPTSVSVDTS